MEDTRVLVTMHLDSKNYLRLEPVLSEDRDKLALSFPERRKDLYQVIIPPEQVANFFDENGILSKDRNRLKEGFYVDKYVELINLFFWIM